MPSSVRAGRRLRASRLDLFKRASCALLESHRYSAQQVFQRLVEEGFAGSLTTVMTTCARSGRRATRHSLSFAPGECAQLDWGEYGSIAVGSTRRRLSFFVMVLCHSRLMYVEFSPWRRPWSISWPATNMPSPPSMAVPRA
ncbi:MAG: hypothetical protein KF778_20960 [Rhodocyclaceae bacterium]|nr:hypothetical protein [Rhodocyclaceae bacterium]